MEEVGHCVLFGAPEVKRVFVRRSINPRRVRHPWSIIRDGKIRGLRPLLARWKSAFRTTRDPTGCFE